MQFPTRQISLSSLAAALGPLTNCSRSFLCRFATAESGKSGCKDIKKTILDIKNLI